MVIVVWWVTVHTFYANKVGDFYGACGQKG